MGKKVSDYINVYKMYIILLFTFSLIINHSLDHGTQLPYIRKAEAEGYDVLVMNSNDNYRNGKPIKHNSSPTAHGQYVWEKFVLNSKYKSVGIVAHSYGGVVAYDLV